MNGKKNTRTEPDAQEEELTVFVMRFKGTGETMRKGLDTVAQALQAMGPAQMVIAPPRVLRNFNAGATVNGAPEADLDENGIIDADGEEADTTEEVASTPSRPAKVRERKPAKIPNLVNDLDYQTPVSLAEYAKQKSPKNATEKYLVIAGWLRHHRQTEEFLVDHLFTCFSLMEWKDRPEDMAQFMRNLKSRTQWFDNGSKSGLWKLTIKGLNHVDNKMGADAAGE